jgi:hypothetical protein
VGLFRRGKRKVGDGGIPGSGLVVEADTEEFWREDGRNRTRLADLGLGSVENRLVLEITLNDGRPTYRVAGTFKVPTKWDDHVSPGARVPLFADPDDPTVLEFNWYAFEAAGGNPGLDPDSAAFKSDVHAAFPAESRTLMVDGWVTAVNAGSMTREQFELAFSGLEQSGILSPADATAARARVDS